jgi:hypothetical protein
MNTSSSIIFSSAASGAWNRTPDQPTPPKTRPKLDLYFGFPIHSVDDRDSRIFKEDRSFKNYTFQTLSQLATRGLLYIPASDSPAPVADIEIDSKELPPPVVCFPWSIVQLNHVEEPLSANDGLVSEMVSLASSAASTALSMFERLARFADEKHDGQHIPPVTIITSVGPNTTVWLAYCAIVDDQYRDHVRTVHQPVHLRA